MGLASLSIRMEGRSADDLNRFEFSSSVAANVSVARNVGELATEHLSHVKLILKY